LNVQESESEKEKAGTPGDGLVVGGTLERLAALA